jgi:tetratricopeptide (TPR) repeat protein
MRVVVLQASGLDKLASGDTESGLAELRAAAQAEAAMPAAFGPPMIEKPSAELLGDNLLRLGRFEEAANAYEAALAAAPGRRLALRGLALARQRRTS